MEGREFLVVETKLYNLSTRGTACSILNRDTNLNHNVSITFQIW